MDPGGDCFKFQGSLAGAVSGAKAGRLCVNVWNINEEGISGTQWAADAVVVPASGGLSASLAGPITRVVSVFKGRAENARGGRALAPAEAAPWGVIVV